jgi:hypothetical protein
MLWISGYGFFTTETQSHRENLFVSVLYSSYRSRKVSTTFTHASNLDANSESPSLYRPAKVFR